MNPERLAAFRKTFGPMSTENLMAIAEGRKATNLSQDALAAIRLLLAERKGGGRQASVCLQPRAGKETPSFAASARAANDEIQINCRKCGQTFAPDLGSKNIHWPCPHCRAKNQNLKRHYRSIALLCVLNLIGAGIWIVSSGKPWEIALAAADAVLLFLTAVAICKSETPWADSTVKLLIRVVFYSAFIFNVVIPVLWGGWLKNSEAAAFALLPYVIGYAVVFPYLFWLEYAARRCTVPRAPRDSYLYASKVQATPIRSRVVAVTACRAPHHPGLKEIVRWPVASLAVLGLVVTLAWALFSRGHSPPRAVESQKEAPGAFSRISDSRHGKPAVLPSLDHGAGRFVADARTPELVVVRAVLPPRSSIPTRSIRPPLEKKPQATVELTGIIGIPGMTRALLEITETGLGRTLKKITVQEGDRVDSIEVVQIDVAKGQVRIRNSGVESVLGLKTAQLGAVAASSQVGSQPSSFGTPPAGWPPFFGDLNGDLDLRIENPNEFSVRVGLRSGGKGKDFLVPPYGTQGVNVPSGHYVSCFHYSREAEAMYQGDSFTLHNNGVQIRVLREFPGDFSLGESGLTGAACLRIQENWGSGRSTAGQRELGLKARCPARLIPG